MNDPANPRQILPSTVSSNSGTAPSTSAVARISVACESCKRKKCKCRGGHPNVRPCQACVNSKVDCIFDESLDKRRKVATKRALEELASHKDILTSLLRAIRTGNDDQVLDLIRQNASLDAIAASLRDVMLDSDEDLESPSADADIHHVDSEATSSSAGQMLAPRRRIRSSEQAVDPILRIDTSNRDSMDLDRPPTEDGDEQEMQLLNHCKTTVTEMLNGTDQEAEELLRQLRTTTGRYSFYNSQLPIRPLRRESQSGFRALPEGSTSIRSNQSGSARRPLMMYPPPRVTGPSTDPYPASYSARSPQTSPTGSSVNGYQLGPPATSPSYSSRSAMDMSRYITSAERRQRESEKSAETNMRPK